MSTQRERHAGRRERRQEIPLLKHPFRQLRNPLPPLQLLNEAQLQQLHLASMQILEEIGLDFLDGETLDIWERAGAKVDHQAQHVWLDRGLIMEAVAKAPPAFTWRARNP